MNRFIPESNNKLVKNIIHSNKMVRHHIKNNKESQENGYDISFCGKRIDFEFHFLDTEHAVRTRQNRAFQLPCIQCKNKVIEELNNKD